MTKRELIERLDRFDDDCQIYIPTNDDGKSDPVAFVCHMPHKNVSIPGIYIPPDVGLLPGDMEKFVTDSLNIEDREGDT